jgi:hypothetical protein
MKTDELIAALSADTPPVAPHTVGRRLAVASVLAAAAALVVLVGWLGLRPDLAQAMGRASFWMKAAYTTAAAISGFLLTDRLARPAGRPGAGSYPLAAALAVILGLAVVDLASTPAALRGAALMGRSWSVCPVRILLISLPAFAVVVWGLRRLAPTRLKLAGAAAGLLAGGVGATIYGLYCQETAAAFVAVWYTLGLGLCAGLGALAGPRVLRW